MQTLRFASATVATHYPLDIAGEATWTRDDAGWSSTIILLRSAQRLHCGAELCAIATRRQSISPRRCGAGTRRGRSRPTARTAPESQRRDPRATTHIDYFHCRANLDAPQLDVTVARRRNRSNTC